ncbi:hypothetical protein [Bacterioplanoides sp. SCSIO 12839]|uniref:beta strand repeat-containing protein n=1 Tax=Bacterioplanoides sp. SCSIO 12839 TaxID=2829569 RepID=UPI002101FDB1|nr:hypothetical protein [Bacterioplanoides sp. SCSIO 12839]UTW47037.1 hypothetical protein KFF03_10585 [Bacterioplanoides sp. SCSIO 12839]
MTVSDPVTDNDDNSAPDPSLSLTAQVLSGNLSGVAYRSVGNTNEQTVEGTIQTDDNGVIPVFVPGTTELSIGDVLLASLTFSENFTNRPTVNVSSPDASASAANENSAVIITLNDLVMDAVDPDAAATNLVALLFLLDDDSNLNNGIAITAETAAALVDTNIAANGVDFDQPLSDFLTSSTITELLAAANISDIPDADTLATIVETSVTTGFGSQSFSLITSPTGELLLDSTSLTVTGKVNDISGTISNGVQLTQTADGSAVTIIYTLDAEDIADDGSWSIEVSNLVSLSTNTLSAEYTDSQGDTVSGTGSVNVLPVPAELNNPLSIALDTSTTPPRALLVESASDRQIIAVDLSNGSRSILTDGANPASGPEFSAPESITLDTSTTTPRALLIDTVLDAVIAIDLSNGNRTILSNADDTTNQNLMVGSGPGLDNPRSITFDSSNPASPRALIADGGLSALVAVDLASGDRSIISDDNDETNNNAVVGTGPGISFPSSITVDNTDADNPRALIADLDLNAIIAIDLTSGNRSVLSDAVDSTNQDLMVGSGVGFERIQSITLDNSNPSSPRALVVDSTLEAVIAVDLDTGNRTVLSDEVDSSNNDAQVGTGVGFAGLQSITLDTSDAENPRALALDGVLGGVVAVDLNNGDRTLLGVNAGSGVLFTTPQSIALDTSNPANPRAVVVDSVANAIYAVNLNTGERSVLSDDDLDGFGINSGGLSVGNGPAFNNLNSILLDNSDPDNPRLLVVDSGLHAVIAVDVDSGDRTIISDDDDTNNNNAQVGTGPGLDFPTSIALDSSDPANPRLFITDADLDAVVSVDLNTGDRTVLSDDDDESNGNAEVGTGIGFRSPQSITLDNRDPDNLALLVVDSSLDAVIAVDVASGNRTVLSDDEDTSNGNAEVGSGAEFSSPQSIILDNRDPDNIRALVTDTSLRAIIAVDLNTGNRTVLSDDSDAFNNNAMVGNGLGFLIPASLTLDTSAIEPRLLVIDPNHDAVFAVNPETGDRLILSGAL